MTTVSDANKAAWKRAYRLHSVVQPSRPATTVMEARKFLAGADSEIKELADKRVIPQSVVGEFLRWAQTSPVVALEDRPVLSPGYVNPDDLIALKDFSAKVGGLDAVERMVGLLKEILPTVNA